MKVGYIGVEFFFILTGIFLYKIARKINSPGVISFSLNKVKKFYLAYVVALVLCYCVKLPYIHELFTADPLHEICRIIGQLLLIQNIGVVEGGINTPTWFFSILIYGGAIVYTLIKYYPKACIRIVFPILTCLFYTSIFNFQDGPGLEQWRVEVFFSMPFLRGVTDISLGVLIGYAFFSYQQIWQKYTKCLDALGIISSILYVWIIFSGQKEAPYAILFICMLLICCLNPDSRIHLIFKSTKWLYLGNMAFDLFLIHVVLKFGIYAIGKYLYLTPLTQFLCYAVLLIPTAYMFRVLINAIQRYFPITKLKRLR